MNIKVDDDHWDNNATDVLGFLASDSSPNRLTTGLMKRI